MDIYHKTLLSKLLNHYLIFRWLLGNSNFNRWLVCDLLFDNLLHNKGYICKFHVPPAFIHCIINENIFRELLLYDVARKFYKVKLHKQKKKGRHIQICSLYNQVKLFAKWMNIAGIIKFFRIKFLSQLFFSCAVI